MASSICMKMIHQQNTLSYTLFLAILYRQDRIIITTGSLNDELVNLIIILYNFFKETIY